MEPTSNQKPEGNQRPIFFTFYSYKGGVGRSMALLNVAYTLIRRGRKVLILDMDLEAPGISGVLARREKNLLEHTSEDIIDLITWAKFDKKNDPDSPSGREDGSPPKMPSFANLSVLLKTVTPSNQNNVTGIHNEGFTKFLATGELHGILLRENEKYFSRLSELLDLKIPQEEGKKNEYNFQYISRSLKKYLKKQKIKVQGIPDYYRNDEAYFDYVLVDSRTGISEDAGLCIGELADRLVVFTALTDQCINGTERLLAEIGIETPRVIYEKRTRNEEVSTKELSANRKTSATYQNQLPVLRGHTITIIVASPVPVGELGLKKSRYHVLEKQLCRHAAEVTYHPEVALSDAIFVNDYPGEHLSSEYKRLTDRVMELSNDYYKQQIDDLRLDLDDEEFTRAAMKIHRLYSYNKWIAEPLIEELIDKIREINNKVPTWIQDGERKAAGSLIDKRNDEKDEMQEAFEGLDKFYRIALQDYPNTEIIFIKWLDLLLRWLNEQILPEKSSAIAKMIQTLILRLPDKEKLEFPPESVAELIKSIEVLCSSKPKQLYWARELAKFGTEITHSVDDDQHQYFNYILASLYAENKEFEKALSYYKNAYEPILANDILEKIHEDIITSYIKTLIMQNDFDTAEKVTTLWIDSPMTYEFREQLKDIVMNIDQFIDKSLSEELLHFQINVFSEIVDHKTVLKIAQSAAEKYPDNLFINSRIPLELLRTHQEKEAMDRYKTLLSEIHSLEDLDNFISQELNEYTQIVREKTDIHRKILGMVENRKKILKSKI